MEFLGRGSHMGPADLCALGAPDGPAWRQGTLSALRNEGLCGRPHESPQLMRQALGNSRASRFSGMRLWAPCVLLMLQQPLVLPAQTPQQWQAAARTIRRLSPDSFPQLPVAIRRALITRGCTVPQSFTDWRPHNVLSGRFAHAQQRDWAVLCSRHDSSSVLIFWARGDPSAPAELGWTADAGFLQGIGAGRIGYSHVIVVASPARIRAYAASFAGLPPKGLDHDGLEEPSRRRARRCSTWSRAAGCR
jgi:hypothetical protein